MDITTITADLGIELDHAHSIIRQMPLKGASTLTAGALLDWDSTNSVLKAATATAPCAVLLEDVGTAPATAITVSVLTSGIVRKEALSNATITDGVLLALDNKGIHAISVKGV